jgi:hypothetical protein
MLMGGRILEMDHGLPAVVEREAGGAEIIFVQSQVDHGAFLPEKDVDRVRAHLGVE